MTQADTGSCLKPQVWLSQAEIDRRLKLQDSPDASYRVTADELRQFIERIERLEAEKKDIIYQQKEVMAEAKGRGYDIKVLRKLVYLRRRDEGEVAEEEAIVELYKEALGM